MQTKLTLRLDSALVEQAKMIAKVNGKSVSQMVADYFVALSTPQHPQANTPGVQSLRGLMRGHEVGVEDYRRHLEEKYL